MAELITTEHGSSPSSSPSPSAASSPA